MAATQGPAELNWPFFNASHRDFKRLLDNWCQRHLSTATHDESRSAVDAECVRLVALLGDGGWLAHAVAGQAQGAAAEHIETRTLCLLRETLAYHNGLSDFALAMQGLGAGAISLHGTTTDLECVWELKVYKQSVQFTKPEVSSIFTWSKHICTNKTWTALKY